MSHQTRRICQCALTGPDIVCFSSRVYTYFGDGRPRWNASPSAPGANEAFNFIPEIRTCARSQSDPMLRSVGSHFPTLTMQTPLSPMDREPRRHKTPKQTRGAQPSGTDLTTVPVHYNLQTDLCPVPPPHKPQLRNSPSRFAVMRASGTRV